MLFVWLSSKDLSVNGGRCSHGAAFRRGSLAAGKSFSDRLKGG